LAGWDLQSTSDVEQSKRVTSPTKTNNEATSKVYDRRKNVTSTYKARANYAASPPTIPAKIGDLLNSAVLLSIQLNTAPNDFVTMTLSGHSHVDGTDGGSLRSIAHSMVLTKGFGVNAFGVTTDEAAIASSLTIQCDHAEEADADGNTAAGENHNPRMSAQITVTGTVDAAALTGWDNVQEGPSTTNEGFLSRQVSLEKGLAFAEA
jgi:hypothetical protein